MGEWRGEDTPQERAGLGRRKIIPLHPRPTIDPGAKLRWNSLEEGRAVALKGHYVLLSGSVTPEARMVRLDLPGGASHFIGTYQSLQNAKDAAQADAQARMNEIKAKRSRQ